MTDAGAPNGGSPKEPKEPASQCGKDSLSRFVARTRHAISGLRVSVERCPDATQERAATGAALAGVAGGLAGLVLRRSIFCGILGGLAGTIAGALASQYHVSVDWDPDRAFGPEPEGEVL